ncbi:aldo/keto reductase [Sphingopyxis terrae]|uniref:aldo/keto reductase n=1 Tax=Sphingopyxis terrae TaxID=33052 RepID=UPI002A11F07E|nr:aldo/keto reductase [Sphingopyxis terrae]MDX8356421.1 aldo/keto reductase [Sphingopyxis terrae]
MHYTHLGHTGLRVSRICLGCMSFGVGGQGTHEWTLDEAASRPFFRQALEAGINFFDTANMYSAGTSEDYTGRALRDFARRDEIVVATKVFGPWRNAPNTGGLSRKALFESVDASLRRLGMDYIDLYQIHRFDRETPVEETMEALHDIVKSGRVRYLGASSMEAWRFAKMQQVAKENGWTRFVSMQPQVNLVYREEEREMIPLCIDQGVGVIPWSPLARGMLTRDWDEKTTRSDTDQFSKMIYGKTAEQDRKVVEAVSAIAAERDIPRAQVALAWLLGKPGITAPIIGATKARHLEDAIAALDVTLSAAEVERLEAPYVPHEVVGMARLSRFDGKVSLLDQEG